MQRALAILALIVALTTIVAACGADDDNGLTLTDDRELVAVPGNSELVVGPNRFALAFIDAANEPLLEEPGTSVQFAFTSPSGETIETEARFVWAIPDVNGFYAADVTFAEAGQWQVASTVARAGEEIEVPFQFPVRDEGQAPEVGEPAVATENLTLDTEPNIRRLSTDPEPIEAFYQTTVAQALEDGRPFVVVFATPAFCQRRFCGPVVDNVKEVYPEYAGGITFIHIEPFELTEDGSLPEGPQGPELQVREPMLDWQLQTEPWVFVVDASGTIAARFEGPASPDELRAALDALG